MVIVLAGFLLGFGLRKDTTAMQTSGAVANAALSPNEPRVPMAPLNFSALAKKVRPGVVNIRTVKKIQGGGPVFRHFFGNPHRDPDSFRDFFGPFGGNQPPRDFKQQSLGSGFIIDKGGYIVTNNHVIENADEIKVHLADGTEYDGTLVGRDPNTDLALIKIKDAPDLVPLKMGNSDKLDVGSWVVAIGSPFGLEQTVTAGIVSAKGRVIGAGPYDDFIQTDASINPGNSGGPLLSMSGEVVGINTAIVAQGQGIGFAIPVNMAQGIIAQLKESGAVTRGWLGVGIQDLTPELADYYGIKTKAGVLVTQVFDGDPADKAGVKPNDIINAIDGKSVTSSRELSATIAGIPIGKQISVTLLRDGAEQTFDVKIAKRADSPKLAKQDPESTPELGLQAAELTPETARRFGHSEEEKGVLVLGVKPDSRAAEAGIRQGDLIKEINRKPVKTIEDLRSGVNNGKESKLLVKRPRAGLMIIKVS